MVKNRASRPGLDVSEQWDRVLALHGSVEQAVAQVLRRRGVGVSEYRALALLAGAVDREIRMLDLAAALRLNQSSVSRLVDRLEADGMVRRDSCGDDRRGVFVVLTDSGDGLLQELTPLYVATLERALREATSDPGVGAIIAALAD